MNRCHKSRMFDAGVLLAGVMLITIATSLAGAAAMSGPTSAPTSGPPAATQSNKSIAKLSGASLRLSIKSPSGDSVWYRLEGRSICHDTNRVKVRSGQEVSLTLEPGLYFLTVGGSGLITQSREVRIGGAPLPMMRLSPPWAIDIHHFEN